MPLDAVRDFLLSHPYQTSAVAAVVAGVVLGWVWTAIRPYNPTAAPVILAARPRWSATGDTPLLRRYPLIPTMGPSGVPRDSRNRTPYAIVGPAMIRRVVEDFYAHVCADPDLADFFDEANMPRLKMHQALFVEHLWGGPAHFPNQRLIEAHQDLYIDPDHYWRLCGHLMVTLTRLKVPDWICVFTMTRLYQARTMIISPEAELEPVTPGASTTSGQAGKVDPVPPPAPPEA